MEMKFLFLPVGNKTNDKGESFFYCPKTMKNFGTLTELIVEAHLSSHIECHCFNILSRNEGSKLIIECERSHQLHSVCTLKVYYENPRHLERINKIIELYTKSYNNGKIPELPKKFDIPLQKINDSLYPSLYSNTS